MTRAHVVAVVVALAGTARADTPSFSPVRSLLLGGAGGGGGAGAARVPQGLFLGVDVGWSELRASTAQPTEDAATYAVRAGYQLRSGVAIEARFDDLALHAPSGGGPLLSITGGVRYSVRLVPMPFVEALAGLATYGDHTTPDVGLGGGVSVLLGRHLIADAALHDWILSIDGDVRHVPTLTVGVSIGY